MSHTYTRLFGLLKHYEIRYYKARQAISQRSGEDYLKWLLKNRYKKLKPRNRLLLLCP